MKLIAKEFKNKLFEIDNFDTLSKFIENQKTFSKLECIEIDRYAETNDELFSDDEFDTVLALLKTHHQYKS